jgi:hypothetical protein
MTVKFNVNDLGEITWCLGMRITTSQDRHCIQLALERYILNKITEYNFDNLSPLPKPMDKDCPTSSSRIRTAPPLMQKRLRW